jgi:aminoglycoside 6'-N-acetyltransferase I
MDVTIRQMGAADLPVWAQLRVELWPDDSFANHQRDIEFFLRRGNFWGLLAELPEHSAVGFAEVAIREYANGCVSRPVAFLEGIWVRPEFRRHRIGAGLLKAAETILIAQGFSELGSDARMENRASYAAHIGWGFAETEKVVYFRKDLKPPAD